MRSLTQVRRLQLENGWMLTVPNEYPAPIRYAPRNVHDPHPFYLELKAKDDEISMAHGYHFAAKQITAQAPTGQPLTLATTMWRHTPMWHVVVANDIAACGRDDAEPFTAALSAVPSDSVCPTCRPYTGIPRPERPERQWISTSGDAQVHIATGERSTACALWCSADDFERIGPLTRTADSDLADDAPRCEVCVKNQDHIDHIEAWRYL